jgi:hypothetical protein
VDANDSTDSKEQLTASTSVEMPEPEELPEYVALHRLGEHRYGRQGTPRAAPSPEA